MLIERASALKCLAYVIKVDGTKRSRLDQYLQLLDWTGRQIRSDKVGAIPEDCAPILERLELNTETWLDVVRNFRKRFRNEAGRPASRQTFRATRQRSRVSSAIPM